MKHRFKFVFIFVLCCGSIFLTGCWDQKIFEEIGLVLQLGLELDENGKLLYSVTLPVIEEGIEERVEVLSTDVMFLREGREKLRNISGKRLEGGKTQQLNFSKELAQQGISDLLDVYLRSPENPLLANIVIVDGSPLEMYEKSLDYRDKSRVSFYVNEIIKDATKRSAAPETRIYDFSILEHAGTIDPLATLLRFDDKKIEVVGSALFDGDRMVGELNCDETGLLHSLMDERINFEYYYRSNDSQDGKGGMALLLKKVKRKVKIDVSDGIPKINISLNYKSSLDEFNDKHRIYLDEELNIVEQKAAASIKEDCAKILEYLKEIGSDPIGFEEMVRTKHNKYYKSIQWDEVYKQILFQVDVKVDVESYGAISG